MKCRNDNHSPGPVIMELVPSSHQRSELQLNKANTSDTEAPFLDLHLSVSNGFVPSKIYDKRDDFDFDIVFHFWMVMFPILPLTGFTFLNLFSLLESSHMADFNAHNKSLTAKLLQQGYRYHKL